MCIRSLLFFIIVLTPPCFASPRVTTLSEAISRTATDNPLFRSQEHRIASSKGSVRQAGLLPNPELELELEEFGGSRDGFNEAETSIAISQPLELGGKRAARIALAEKHAEIVMLENQIQGAEIINRVEIAYARIQQEQAKTAALQEQIRLSQQIVNVASRKLKAGAILPIEKTKALISWQKNKARAIEAENELLKAKLALSSLWKGSPSDIKEVEKASLPANARDYLELRKVEESPYSRLLHAGRELADEQLTLEESRAIPNVRIGAGVKRFEENDDTTFLGTFSVELPLFNRNQGAIDSARKQRSVRELIKENDLLEMRTSFSSLQHELRQLLEQHQILHRAILPSAEQAYREAEQAYRQGRTSYLELNDARETLFESKLKESNLLFEISVAISSIRQLTGESLRASRPGIH